MNFLQPLIAIEVKSLGQIGAGKVVEFIPRNNKRWIPLPKNARSFDQFTEIEVSGSSLEDLNIFDGDFLTCRTNFDISEIRANTICLVYIEPLNEYMAKMVQINDDNTITLIGASSRYTPQTFFADEIQILALAVEVRRKL